MVIIKVFTAHQHLLLFIETDHPVYDGEVVPHHMRCIFVHTWEVCGVETSSPRGWRCDLCILFLTVALGFLRGTALKLFAAVIPAWFPPPPCCQSQIPVPVPVGWLFTEDMRQLISSGFSASEASLHVTADLYNAIVSRQHLYTFLDELGCSKNCSDETCPTKSRLKKCHLCFWKQTSWPAAKHNSCMS